MTSNFHYLTLQFKKFSGILKKSIELNNDVSSLSSMFMSPIKSSSSCNTTGVSEETVSKSEFKNQLLALDKKYSTKLKSQTKKIESQEKIIGKLMSSVRQLKRRLDESDIKYRELSLNMCQIQSGSPDKVNPSKSNPKIIAGKSQQQVKRRKIQNTSHELGNKSELATSSKYTLRNVMKRKQND